MFNTIAREIEKNPSRTLADSGSGTSLDRAWTIWGR
jgi:hypothetical protein